MARLRYMNPNSEGWKALKQFSSVRDYCGPQAPAFEVGEAGDGRRRVFGSQSPLFRRQPGYRKHRAIALVAIGGRALKRRGSVECAVRGLNHTGHRVGAIRSAEWQLMFHTAAGAHREHLPKIIQIPGDVINVGAPQIAVRRLQQGTDIVPPRVGYGEG